MLYWIANFVKYSKITPTPVHLFPMNKLKCSAAACYQLVAEKTGKGGSEEQTGMDMFCELPGEDIEKYSVAYHKFCVNNTVSIIKSYGPIKSYVLQKILRNLLNKNKRAFCSKYKEDLRAIYNGLKKWLSEGGEGGTGPELPQNNTKNFCEQDHKLQENQSSSTGLMR